MASLGSFIAKVKKKNLEYKNKRDENLARSKGFSSKQAYDFYSEAARSEGKEKAESQLRKAELKRIKEEAREERLLNQSGKYNKIQSKIQKGFNSFQKGTGVYNEIMGGLKSINSPGDSFFPKQNSRQAYASGYGLYPNRNKSRTKKQKPIKRHTHKKRSQSFWNQFM